MRKAIVYCHYIDAGLLEEERFFKLVVFNYIYGNGDDHLKNFSIMRIGEHYQLAPAYDLTPYRGR
ncbi:HipA domain-containing protein [Segatella copri]|uniref:HipA domain-containing protein n=1 Tax=Segatella copri TaxID=165179 RepID=UPI003F72971F